MLTEWVLAWLRALWFPVLWAWGLEARPLNWGPTW